MMQVETYRFGTLALAAVVALHTTIEACVAQGPTELKCEVTTAYAPIPRDERAIDLSPYTVKRVREKIPSKYRGTVRIGPVDAEPLLVEAFRGERGKDLEVRQGGTRRAVFVEGGAVTAQQLVDQLGDSSVAELSESYVTLRLPVVVKPGATLVVDGRQAPVLRLSTDRGAFIANGGTLVILKARVTSWSESTDGPTLFEHESQFRPYIASYVRSQTLLAGSSFEHLGYYAPSAYGVSLTSHPERNRGAANDDWPTGVIVDSEFRGLFYGFYSYEARDVAIVDNRYAENIRYGIDPHDRSTRLVIARNTASGTRERHGIIGSREVSHSWIVDNVARDNAGSGIMLDRQCAHNLIRGNKVYRNGQGIAIYESPHNRLQDNLVAFNAKSGIRVRNSVDVAAVDNRLIGNGDYAFELSARRLDDHEQRAKRGDHYLAAVEVEIHGVRVAGNRGLVKAAQLDGLKLSGVQVDQQAAEVVAEFGAKGFAIDNAKNLSVGTDLKPLARDVLRALDPDRPLVDIRLAK